jgi:2-oxoglutarate ferredoxin oxidoreductase subunit gamma
MVVFSSEEISSPLVFQGDVMMVLDSSQLLPFRNRVRPGGLLIAEAAGLPQEAEELPVQRVAVPALELATSLGDTLVANLVMLGAYVEAAGTLAPELVEKELEARFGVAETAISISAEKQPLLQLNLDAFHLGQDWARRSVVRPG